MALMSDPSLREDGDTISVRRGWWHWTLVCTRSNGIGGAPNAGPEHSGHAATKATVNFQAGIAAGADVEWFQNGHGVHLVEMGTAPSRPARFTTATPPSTYAQTSTQPVRLGGRPGRRM